MRALKYSILLSTTYLLIAFIMWLITDNEAVEHINNLIIKILE
jgi:hypothetical protein